MKPSQRSKSKRKLARKTPGRRTTIIFKKKKHGKAKCAICGKQLAGTPVKRPYKMKISKSRKRPERPYGGNLCSNCSRDISKNRARKSQ